MKIEVNRLLAPVTVLGAGRRVGLWVQGCRLRCLGCASQDTWVVGQGEERDTEDVADVIATETKARDLDGLTLTGGEPLDQARALALVVEGVRGRLAGSPQGDRFDVLLFSGYPAAAAQKRAGRLWPLLDLAVCGPYRPGEPSEQPLVASANQDMLLLTELGRAKYPLPDDTPRMQVVSDGTDLLMVGLPRPGDLDAIAGRLEERGVTLGGASWRS
jgi:anaerobic ribonucleoside-triphosphate reductase activating protein